MLMHKARQLGPLLRLAKPTVPREVPVGRYYSSTDTQQKQRPTVDDDDIRPSWVYSGSRMLKYTAIPLTLLYCALFADWGERDHVFVPLRSWVSRHKQSILSLSPEEAALVQGDKGRPVGSSPSQNVD